MLHILLMVPTNGLAEDAVNRLKDMSLNPIKLSATPGHIKDIKSGTHQVIVGVPETICGHHWMTTF